MLVPEFFCEVTWSVRRGSVANRSRREGGEHEELYSAIGIDILPANAFAGAGSGTSTAGTGIHLCRWRYSQLGTEPWIWRGRVFHKELRSGCRCDGAGLGHNRPRWRFQLDGGGFGGWVFPFLPQEAPGPAVAVC